MKCQHLVLAEKPGTLLLEQAAEEHGFSVEESILIGDSTSDFAAASKWGICSISGCTPDMVVRTAKVKADPDYWQDDLWSAVEFLLANAS